MDLAILQKEAWAHSINKGFHNAKHNEQDVNDRHYFATFIALGMGEFSEALEELRHEIIDWDKFAEELADVVIRVADLAELTQVDLETAVIKKMEKNKDRGYRHGRKML
jgi:NTP pyrophosphatase (non-canonical NTP hydrolase)